MRERPGRPGIAACGLLFCALAARASWAGPADRAEDACAAAIGERSAHDDAGRVVWTRDRRLAWSDFQGNAPARAAEGAGSCVGFSVSWECPAGELRFGIMATFDPGASWVERGAESPLLLRHEQLHFDLTELFARRLRKQFTDLRDPCQNPGDARQVLDGAVVGAYREWQEAQRRYDAETRRGTDAAVQGGWERRTRRELEDLEAFGRGEVP
jgi:hypothetical protein